MRGRTKGLHCAADWKHALTTHHGCYFTFGAAVDAGQHKRTQEEEDGASGGVNQVLQEDTKTQGLIVDLSL